MSVLIKGMEMPSSCWDCEVGGAKQMDNATCPFYSMEFWEQENYQDKIADGCPLVHVPPHGRLGDLDALYSHIKDEQRKCNDPYDGWSECQVALGFVNTAPTIIQAEEATKV